MIGTLPTHKHGRLFVACSVVAAVCLSSCSGSASPKGSASPSGTILATEGGGQQPGTQTWTGDSHLAAFQSVTNNHCRSVWTVSMKVNVDSSGKAAGRATADNQGIHCVRGFAGSETKSLKFDVVGTLDDAGFTLDMRNPEIVGTSGFFGGFEVLWLPLGNPPILKIPLVSSNEAKGVVAIAHSGDFEGQGTGRVSGTLDLSCGNC